MTISVSSSEARKGLGKLLILASEKNEEVVIKVRGEPTAVIVSYSQYEQLIKDKEARKREEALRLLRSARARVQERMEGVSREEAYRMAGFGENVIKEIIQHEDEVAANG